MIDKTLLLKGVAGVATLGGVGGAGFLFKDQISSAISGSSAENSVNKGGNREETGRNNLESESHSQGAKDTALTDNQDPKPKGGGGDKVSSTSTTVSTVDEQGIPKTCTSSCDLTEEDLKKIKFETLEAEGVTGDVTVENFPSGEGQKISLTIDSTESSNKRYIFNNPSNKDVKIKRGDKSSVTLKKSGKTKFSLNDKKLKERELNVYGVPKECENTKPCTLTSTDLEDIKFEALKDGTGNATVSPSDKTVTLTIETTGSSKKYKFKNTDSSEITITKGSGESAKKVILKANGDTEFTEESGNVLKFVEPIEANGIPTKCTAAGSSTECQLTEENLKNIKFKVLEEVSEGTVTIDPTPSSITLKITSPANSNPKIYTFNNSSNSAVTLKKGSTGSEKSVTLEVGENDFKDEDNKLVSYEDPTLKKVNNKLVDTLKFPVKCKFKNSEKSKFTKECDVTLAELKKIEFENKGTGDSNIEGPSSGNIKLEIRRLRKNDEVDTGQYGTSINDDDLKVIFKDTTSKITIKKNGSGNDIVVPQGSNMEFLVNTENKLNRSYSSLNTLPNGIRVTCTDTNKDCTPSNSSINIFDDSNLSTFKELTISNGNQAIFTADKDQDNYNLGYKFTVKSGVSGSSVSLTTGNTYEIKYSKSQKKWGFVKKNG